MRVHRVGSLAVVVAAGGCIGDTVGLQGGLSSLPDTDANDALVVDGRPPARDAGPEAPDAAGADAAGLDFGIDVGIDAGPPSLDGGVGCTRDFDCARFVSTCTEAFCDLAAGVCAIRPRSPDTRCSDGIACTVDDRCLDGVCRGTPRPPTNDTCAAPAFVRFEVGDIVVDGETTCSDDSATASCAAPGGSDSVLQFELDEPRRVRIRTSEPAGPPRFAAALYLRRACAATGDEVACSRDATEFAQIDENLEPGNYFLFVDGANEGEVGRYRLRIDFDPQNTCAAPTPIPVPAVGQTVVFRGTTAGGTNDFESSCGSSAADHVYVLDIAEPTRLQFETRRGMVLHLHRGPCTPGRGPRDFCDADSGALASALITATLSAGEWFLVVDGVGLYELAVATLQPSSP